MKRLFLIVTLTLLLSANVVAGEMPFPVPPPPPPGQLTVEQTVDAANTEDGNQGSLLNEVKQFFDALLDLAVS